MGWYKGRLRRADLVVVGLIASSSEHFHVLPLPHVQLHKASQCVVARNYSSRAHRRGASIPKMPLSMPSYLRTPSQPLSLLRRINNHNVHTLRSSPLAELSGSLGDLGTLLPLLLALTLSRSIYLAPTLLFTGAANILTGLLFGVPLPVQPMKAIAAVAIAKGYSVEETMASGLSMGIAIGVLTVTGLLGGNEDIETKSEGARAQRRGWGLMRWVPVPVVKGIQVGAGLSLCLSAGEKMLVPLGWRGSWWGDNLAWAVGAAIVVLASDLGASRFGVSRIPAALIIFIVGLVLAAIRLHTSPDSSSLVDLAVETNDHPPFEHIPSWPRSRTFADTISTALGQLPLTTLNSILAVTHLASDLYPSGFPPPPSPGALGFSISLMNILGCIFGAMPACHGSGGLAGQFKFGARSGASIIILGLFKFVLGLIAVGVGGLEKGMVNVLEAFPKALLGVMVIAAGVELAKVGGTVNDGARDLWEAVDADAEGDDGLIIAHGRRGRYRQLTEQERKERFSVMIVTVATLLAFKNDGIGFVVGMIWHWALRMPNIWERSRRQGRHFHDASTEEERSGLLS